MSRTCDDCGSSWDGRATFCGHCGELLDEGLSSRVSREGGGRRSWWRPWFGGVAAALLVAGVVAAVPRLSLERTPPVDGDIGVPEPDDLNAAPASARTRSRAADPPELTCTVDGAPVECVRWSRRVLEPEGAERGGGWLMGAGGDHLVAAGNDGVAVFDAAAGTRLWRSEGGGVFPLGMAEGHVLLEAQGRAVLRDLDDGTVTWTSTAGGSGFLGGTIVGDVAVLGDHTADGSSHVVGRGMADGAERWRLEVPGAMHVVGEVTPGRVLLEAVDGRSEQVLVDAATGEAVAQFELPEGWPAGFVGDVGLFVTEREGDPADPNLAGDGGGTLHAVRLEDGTVTWQHDLRAVERPVMLAQGTVLSPSTDRLVALDATTGETRWELDLPGALDVADHGSRAWWGPWSARDDLARVAIVHDQVDRLVRAHDLRNGDPLWERTLDVRPQHVFVADDLLMVHTDDGVTLLDPATGDERVSIALDGGHLAGWAPLTVVHPPSGYAARLDVAGVDVP